MTKTTVRNLLTTLIFVIAGALTPASSFAADGTLTDDAYTSVKTPNKNFGGDGVIAVEGGEATAYLKFSLANFPAGVTGNDVMKATLKLWVNNVKNAGSFDVVRVNGAWTENGLTLATAPALGAVEASAVPVGTAVVGKQP